MFQKFQDFIPKAAQKYGITNEMRAAKICHDFRTIRPRLFKNLDLPENSISPAYYKDNTLVINVESPALGQEVIMRKTKIIDELNTKAGQKIIKSIKTKLFS